MPSSIKKTQKDRFAVRKKKCIYIHIHTHTHTYISARFLYCSLLFFKTKDLYYTTIPTNYKISQNSIQIYRIQYSRSSNRTSGTKNHSKNQRTTTDTAKTSHAKTHIHIHDWKYKNKTHKIRSTGSETTTNLKAYEQVRQSLLKANSRE